MEEYKDYFLIYDACRTELEKESPTCIGFRPMEAEEINYTIKGQNGKWLKGNGALYTHPWRLMKRENIIFALIVEKR